MPSERNATLRDVALIILVCVILFAPGIAQVPIIDRDEGLYVTASRQMLQTGEYLDIRLLDLPRYRKPHGIYWMQAASVALFSDPDSAAPWPYRLISLIGATIATLGVYFIGRTLFGWATGLLAALVFAASTIVIVEAHIAKTDAALLATIVLAGLALARAYGFARDGPEAGRSPPGAGLALLFWGAVTAGALIKGPVILIYVVLAAAALSVADRDLGWLRVLRPGLGAAVSLAVIAVWAVVVYLAAGPLFFHEGIYVAFLSKSTQVQEGHGGPPGLHLALLPVVFFPGVVLVVAAAMTAWRERGTAAVRFCLAWIVPSWLVFEMVSTKLPHYVMPILPAFALLVAHAAVTGAPSITAWPARVWAALCALAFAAAAGSVLFLADLLPSVGWVTAALVAATGILGAAVVFVLVWRGRACAALIAGVITMAAFSIAVFQVLLPLADDLWLSRRVAQEVDAVREAPDQPVAVAHAFDYSLFFEIGGNITQVDGKGAARFLAAAPNALAVVNADRHPDFIDAAAERGVDPVLVAAVDGYDHVHGRWTTVRVYRLPAAPGEDPIAPPPVDRR